MKKYFLTKDLNQHFEQVVHDESCLYIAHIEDIILLGNFENCKDALAVSNKIGKKTNGCFWCCRKIHNLIDA